MYFNVKQSLFLQCKSKIKITMWNSYEKILFYETVFAKFFSIWYSRENYTMWNSPYKTLYNVKQLYVSRKKKHFSVWNGHEKDLTIQTVFTKYFSVRKNHFKKLYSRNSLYKILFCVK